MAPRRAGSLSVVFPAFDEERGIERAIAAVTAYLEPRVEGFEVVVVDDGSRDRTAERVGAVSARDPRVRLVRSESNHGKGHAVRQGVLATRGDVVVFLDVDLSTPIETLERAWPVLEGGAHVVVGSRRMAGSDVQVHQGAIRELLGDLFRRSTRRILGISVSDLTCGFKVLRGREGRALFRRVTLEDWSFDVELLVAASEAGLTVRDVPVTWRDDPESKVRLGRDLPLALFGVMRVFRRRIRGDYDAPLELETD